MGKQKNGRNKKNRTKDHGKETTSILILGKDRTQSSRGKERRQRESGSV